MEHLDVLKLQELLMEFEEDHPSRELARTLRVVDAELAKPTGAETSRSAPMIDIDIESLAFGGPS